MPCYIIPVFVPYLSLVLFISLSLANELFLLSLLTLYHRFQIPFVVPYAMVKSSLSEGFSQFLSHSLLILYLHLTCFYNSPNNIHYYFLFIVSQPGCGVRRILCCSDLVLVLGRHCALDSQKIASFSMSLPFSQYSCPFS